jgi:hypothetical protein
LLSHHATAVASTCLVLPTSMPLTAVQEAHLKTLFETGQAPYEPANGDTISAATIKTVWDSHPVLQSGNKKPSFYALYRRKAAVFLTEQTKSGARRPTG